jgi:hypothetical protein
MHVSFELFMTVRLVIGLRSTHLYFLVIDQQSQPKRKKTRVEQHSAGKRKREKRSIKIKSAGGRLSVLCAQQKTAKGRHSTQQQTEEKHTADSR